jgi:RNA polymerase sigma-70 factor (ECF subfamily)
MSAEDDSILVGRSLEGDRASFGVLVAKYMKPIFNLTLRMLNNRDDAADITQSAFTKAFENLRRFDRKQKFFSWLYRIAINESLNALDKRKPTDEISENLPSLELSPDESLRKSEQQELVQKALMALTPEYRSVMVLRHFMELTYAEMSTTLGIPEKKVKSRLFSARQQLRTLLINQGIAR